MKKSIFSLMIGAVVALASCSKSDEAPNLPQSGDQLATFVIGTPATRSAVEGLSRYIVEAYEGNNLSTTPLRVEAQTGSLTLELKKNTDYTFVFWADKGTAMTGDVASSGYYNTTDLKAVEVSEDRKNTVGEVAYCLAVSFNSKDFEANKTVMLKNATSQINFMEAAGLLTANNTLRVVYSNSGKLNVATGQITELDSEIRTYSDIVQTAKDGIVATDYILAPLGDKRLLDLKVTFNAEPEKTIAGVPLQQNYKTNIKGEFSNFYASVFTVSDQVEDYTNDEVGIVEKAKVGDFYYDDKSYSSILDADKTCIGIVYVVNPDGTTGKIVGLTEASRMSWGAGGVLETVDGINSKTDGATATKNMIMACKGEPDFKYSVFYWVYNDINEKNLDGRWYIPAINELEPIDTSFDAVNSSLDAVNSSATAVATKIRNDKRYWTSTQADANNAYSMSFCLYELTLSVKNEMADRHARVVSAF